jgi:phage shock protein C
MSQSAVPAYAGDNLLGVCNAVGEAFGISPLFIRLAFALCFILNFGLALATYAALGVAVLLEKILSWTVVRFRRPALKAG